MTNCSPALAKPGSSMNHRHEYMLEWLLCNPTRPLGDLAKELGYTIGWVSQIVHSDMFQARYRELCAERDQLAVHTMGSLLASTAVMALQRTQTRLETGNFSEKFLVDSSRTLFGALGFGPKAAEAAPQQHLHLHVTASDIARARATAAEHFAGRSGGQGPQQDLSAALPLEFESAA